ncbi:type II secretion system protein N [Ferrovum sp.]|uniref:type II secretion system protein N n=1 Tax=Ferrovum sp. TaxID=2609467 RepID=UPI002635DD65|nr:type II secretion system protein N [Ferrovum sp.]
MKRTLHGAILGLGILVLLGMMLWQWPATALSLWASTRSGGSVRLTNEVGTLWHGSAELAVVNDQTEGDWPGRIEWRIRPQWTGLGFSLTNATDRAGVLVQGHWHGGVWDLQPGQGYFPAQLLEGLGMPFTTLHPGGMVRVQWGAAQWQGRELTHPWTVECFLESLTSRLSPVTPLGSYEVRAVMSRLGTHLTLATRQGPLQLRGEGEQEAGKFHFTGQASADPAQRFVLAGLLSILGKPEGEGVRLDYVP